MARIAQLSVGLFCLVATANASAEPIVVTSGFLIAHRSEAGGVSLQGTRGFSLSGSVDPFEGRVDALSCLPCLPGSPLSAGANLSGSVFTGPATLDGITYSDISGVDAPASVYMEVFGGTITPAFRNEPTTIRTPFTALGQFNLPYPGTPVPLRAAGFATLLLRPNPVVDDMPNWFVESVRYDFVDPSVVPEPATIVLVSGGLLAIARRRHLRRGRPDL